jgi:transposase
LAGRNTVMEFHANARTCFHCRSLIVSRVIDKREMPSFVAAEFRVTARTVHKWVRRFRTSGFEGLRDRSSRPHHIPRQQLSPDSSELRDAVFSLLHSPPTESGFNRTTWRLSDLRAVLCARGIVSTPRSISIVIKRAGYRWKQARVTLTSKDSEYRYKVELIHQTLSQLKDDEAFFSIDEFGPFAVKMQGGKSLQGPKQLRMVPQLQVSKGSLIVSAALDLSRNQVLHFFSERKNTSETIKLIELIRKEYKGYRLVYLSWDAATWHSSAELFEKIEFLNGWAAYDGAPELQILPLPSGAQFLNVIESVFSGMARAIIHNSDYPSVEHAKVAIDRHFAERNLHFRNRKQRAGGAIWGREPAPATFLLANNCKDPKYQ